MPSVERTEVTAIPCRDLLPAATLRSAGVARILLVGCHGGAKLANIAAGAVVCVVVRTSLVSCADSWWRRLLGDGFLASGDHDGTNN